MRLPCLLFTWLFPLGSTKSDGGGGSRVHQLCGLLPRDCACFCFKAPLLWGGSLFCSPYHIRSYGKVSKLVHVTKED